MNIKETRAMPRCTRMNAAMATCLLPAMLAAPAAQAVETTTIDASATLSKAAPLGSMAVEQSIEFGEVTWPRVSDGSSCTYSADPDRKVEASDPAFASIDPVKLGCERKGGTAQVGVVTLSCSGDAYRLSVDAGTSPVFGATVNLSTSSRYLQVDGVGIETASLKCAPEIKVTVSPELRLRGAAVETGGNVKVGTVLLFATFE